MAFVRVDGLLARLDPVRTERMRYKEYTFDRGKILTITGIFRLLHGVGHGADIIHRQPTPSILR